MDNLRARRGDMVCFSSGEYSDYCYIGHFVALDNITEEHFLAAKEHAEIRQRETEEAQDSWKVGSGEPYPSDVSLRECFINALIREGLLLSITVTEHHLGDYYGILEI